MGQRKKVVIIGGGVAGLTAAHELIERDFDVTLYERRDAFGGKAASERVIKGKSNGNGAGPTYPTEHGFRFLPGWYRHLPDTMSRIPSRRTSEGAARQTVADHLVPVGQNLMARYDRDPIPIVLHVPRSKNQAQGIVSFFGEIQKMGLTIEEAAFFFQKLAQFLRLPEDARRREFDAISWWSFVDAENRSAAFRALTIATTRTLVAAKASEASAYTIATMAVRTLFESSLTIDRVLDGPTSEVWLKPWVRHLEAKGVRFVPGYELDRIVFDGTAPAVAGLVLSKVEAARDWRKLRASWRKGETKPPGPGASPADIKPLAPEKIEIGDGVDYYVFALPVEQMAYYVNRSNMLTYYDSTLRNIVSLSNSVDWMTGIQFYLRFQIDLPPGHIVCSDSEWALTAIEQTRFWRDVRLPDEVQSILSVDISAWDQIGRFVQKPAFGCTRDEIAREVWRQLKASLNRKGRQDILRDDMLVNGVLDSNSYNLDDNVADKFDRKKQAVYNRSQAVRFSADESLYDTADRFVPPFAFGDRLELNVEPILVNRPGGLQFRPPAVTKISNMFLAADYVATATNLACMEGANEAARQAVNGILEAAGSREDRCQTWQFADQDVLGRVATFLTLGEQLPGMRASMEVAASAVASAGAAATRAKDAIFQFWKRP
jgi:15-cis-phytoene desaturase